MRVIVATIIALQFRVLFGAFKLQTESWVELQSSFTDTEMAAANGASVYDGYTQTFGAASERQTLLYTWASTPGATDYLRGLLNTEIVVYLHEVPDIGAKNIEPCLLLSGSGGFGSALLGDLDMDGQPEVLLQQIRRGVLLHSHTLLPSAVAQHLPVCCTFQSCCLFCYPK